MPQSYKPQSDLAELATLMQMMDGGQRPQQDNSYHYLAQLMQQQQNAASQDYHNRSLAQQKELKMADLDRERGRDALLEKHYANEAAAAGRRDNLMALHNLQAIGQSDSPIAQQLMQSLFPQEVAAAQQQHLAQTQQGLNSQLQKLYSTYGGKVGELQKVLPHLEQAYSGNPTMRRAWESAPWEEMNQGLQGGVHSGSSGSTWNAVSDLLGGGTTTGGLSSQDVAALGFVPPHWNQSATNSSPVGTIAERYPTQNDGGVTQNDLTSAFGVTPNDAFTPEMIDYLNGKPTNAKSKATQFGDWLTKTFAPPINY